MTKGGIVEITPLFVAAAFSELTKDAGTSDAGSADGSDSSSSAISYDSGLTSCVVTQATETSKSTPAPTTTGATSTLVSAGIITITGGSMPLMLAPESTNGQLQYVATNLTTGVTFPGGAPLVISASGATVPAFSEMVTMPADLSLTAPAADDASGVTIPRSEDLSFTWVGGDPLGRVPSRRERVELRGGVPV